ncbi:undecaprenyl-phosphate galactose phosphotransferase WbaP [Leptolyngbya sp. PCC 6406]|uniref:undecaprenyl-phosphate galactose phosphotransferase WbaP n=1 Tax=Leptolyngbya sp. PCC 6406 TaxID=1173264 RepID=UPI0002ABB2F2|nr:undecaprenyl-phosphate galactose phosphotransferase WbaP [Leptolyngbya sp. PCC 6406]
MLPSAQVLRPFLRPLSLSLRSLPTVAVLLAVDGITLILAASASVGIRLAFKGQFDPQLYWQLWPVIVGLLLIYTVAGLYSVGISPVDELRRLCVATTALYLGLSTLIFLLREGTTYSRSIFLMAWLLSMALAWLGRMGIRYICAPRSWWGHPVLILGAGKTGALVVRTLKRQPGLGLKPVAVLDDDPQKQGFLEGVPVLGQLSLAPYAARELGVGHAIVAMPGVPREKLLSILEQYGHTFPHLLMIPDLFGFASLWISTRDLGGMLGLEIRQRLFLPGPRLTKALIELILTVLLGVLVLPLMGCIMLAVKLDSPGPIFYGQKRLGKGGMPFTAWKFRSMVRDGDQVLVTYLRQHPHLEAEWNRDRKLKNDPRVTRVGRFLRRTSLDELPQLWNVLRGEMSLVGPRPIVGDEIRHYADKFELYKRVLPGITGLWQVSGRSDITYAERVNLDAYYVRNWSVWLDFYILLQTVGVVLLGDGAY